MIKLIAMTTLCADIFDGTCEICPGGEALNFSAIASEYDNMDISIIGAIGNDDLGKKVLLSISKKNINTDSIHISNILPTASNRIYLTSQGDRYFKSNSWNGGAYANFKLSDNDKEVILQSEIVFINYSSPNFNDVLALRKKGSFKLAVDFNVERDFDNLEHILDYVDYFFISGEEEILPVFKTCSQKHNSIYNITLAEKGSVTYQNGFEYRVNAIEVDNVVDTTGCGDSYHAGFICSYLKDNDIINAMNEGSKKASNTLLHIGGFVY